MTKLGTTLDSTYVILLIFPIRIVVIFLTKRWNKNDNFDKNKNS